MLEEGQKVLVGGEGPGRGAAAARATARSRSCSASARSCSASATTEVTTRLIEGEFPNYQQLIPSGYPNRLTVSRDALQAAVNRVRLVGQSRDTAPIRLGDDAEGLELSATAQDVGEAHEAVEAKYEGTDLTVAFNSQFLLDGIEAAGVRRGRDRVDRPAEAGGAAGHRLGRLPLPADARPHRLSARACGVYAGRRSG